MFPNPQDALPLPPQPNLEQYRKLAKDLVKACRSADGTAVRAWAGRWIERLASLDERPAPLLGDWVDRRVSDVEHFATDRLAGGRTGHKPCALTDAQFVIARAHGFSSWPAFAAHLESLARETSDVSTFEAAADAIVSGDTAAVERLLRDHPGLVHARSTREHHATLLHYVSANGVEGYRQRSPKTIARITSILLAAGAEVDAEAQVYGGGCTALGLVATSSPPRDAGVQLDVIDVLVEHGARMDRVGSAGNTQALIRACLANGCPEAAAHLIARGARLDFAGAAGTGQLEFLRRFVTNGRGPIAGVTSVDVAEGLAMAAGYGRVETVEFLLDHGIGVDAELRLYGQGHTALHVASYHAHVDVVRVLLQAGARVDVRDQTWGTPAITWALTGWSHGKAPDDRYHETVAMLVTAGSEVKPEWLEWDKVRADPAMRAALSR